MNASATDFTIGTMWDVVMDFSTSSQLLGLPSSDV